MITIRILKKIHKIFVDPIVFKELKDGYKFLLLICGSHKVLTLGMVCLRTSSITVLATSNPPFNPLYVTKLKSSSDV